MRRTRLLKDILKDLFPWYTPSEHCSGFNIIGDIAVLKLPLNIDAPAARDCCGASPSPSIFENYPPTNGGVKRRAENKKT
ncbi:MAG: hypothetical protein V1857_00940 [archaeon]